MLTLTLTLVFTWTLTLWLTLTRLPGRIVLLGQGFFCFGIGFLIIFSITTPFTHSSFLVTPLLAEL